MGDSSKDANAKDINLKTVLGLLMATISAFAVSLNQFHRINHGSKKKHDCNHF